MKGDICLECKLRDEFIKEIAKSYDQFTINDIYIEYFELCKDTCTLYNRRKLLNPGQVTYQISNTDYSSFLKFKDDVYYSFECFLGKKELINEDTSFENYPENMFEVYINVC